MLEGRKTLVFVLWSKDKPYEFPVIREPDKFDSLWEKRCSKVCKRAIVAVNL